MEIAVRLPLLIVLKLETLDLNWRDCKTGGRQHPYPSKQRQEVQEGVQRRGTLDPHPQVGHLILSDTASADASLAWGWGNGQIAAQVKNDMHEIATKYDFKVGKFLVFRPPETIDELRFPLALHPCISPAGRPLV